MSEILSLTDIKSRIKSELPEYAFKRTPNQAWLVLAFNLVVATCFYIMINNNLQWYWYILLSVILGHQYFLLGIISHDIMHGAILKNKNMRMLVSYFGFYPFLFSPRLWDAWHNKAHHGRTNTSHDPDANLTIDDFKNIPIARLANYLMPSSNNRFFGVIFYTYWFTLVSQVILWQNHHFKAWEFDRFQLDLNKARLETISYYCFWILIAYIAGPYKSLFLILIPWMVGNIIFMSFASSEHVFLPQTNRNNPLENSASVKMPKFVDFITLNFSNHVEHHLFPSMSYLYTPLVRSWLRVNMKDVYMEPTIIETFTLVFNTPRYYATSVLLRHPYDPPERTIDTQKIRSALRNKKRISFSSFEEDFNAITGK